MYDARIRKTEFPQGVQSLSLSSSVKRVIKTSTVKMMAALGGTALLLYAVSIAPGLLIFFLPGLIALGGKVYDEAQLIHFLRYGDPIKTEHWEDTEKHTEKIRNRSFENHSFSMTF